MRHFVYVFAFTVVFRFTVVSSQLEKWTLVLLFFLCFLLVRPITWPGVFKMNLAIPKEGQSLCLKVRKELGERDQILWKSPCRTKSSVFLIKTLSRILMSLLGSRREPDFFIPLMTFKNKYYVNLTFKCFLFYLFIKHFLIVALCQKKFIPVNFWFSNQPSY